MAQMVKPPYDNELSEEKVIVSPGTIAAFMGPVMPLYRVPPIVR